MKGQLTTFIHQKIWEDLTAKKFSHGYKWGTKVSKFVSKLIRHEISRERETDGASHWNFTIPKLRIKIRSDGGNNCTDRDWINFIWKRRNKTRFQYCQNSYNKLLYIRAIQGHTGGKMIEPEMLGHVLFPHKLEGVCIPSRIFIQF